MIKIVSKRISAGLYEVAVGGRLFQVEDAYQARGEDGYPRNDWNLFEMKSKDSDREYCQSFSSKKDAMRAIEAAQNGEW